MVDLCLHASFPSGKQGIVVPVLRPSSCWAPCCPAVQMVFEASVATYVSCLPRLVYLLLHASLQEAVVLHPTGRGPRLQDTTHALGRWHSLWRGQVGRLHQTVLTCFPSDLPGTLISNFNLLSTLHKKSFIILTFNDRFVAAIILDAGGV